VSAPAGAPPDLFADVTPCPRDVAPLPHGSFAWRSASSRAERYPFDASEGVAAVRLYSEAAACFRASGEAALAQAVAAEAAPVRARVDSDYVALRLDLELALAGGDHLRALTAVRALMPLLAHLPDVAYAEKLKGVERLLSLKGESR
jgi:hypothetical protein